MGEIDGLLAAAHDGKESDSHMCPFAQTRQRGSSVNFRYGAKSALAVQGPVQPVHVRAEMKSGGRICPRTTPSGLPYGGVHLERVGAAP